MAIAAYKLERVEASPGEQGHQFWSGPGRAFHLLHTSTACFGSVKKVCELRMGEGESAYCSQLSRGGGGFRCVLV